MKLTGLDYWDWLVLTMVRDTGTGRDISKQFDRAGALARMIDGGYVIAFGASSVDESQVRLTHTGLIKLKALDQRINSYSELEVIE